MAAGFGPGQGDSVVGGLVPVAEEVGGVWVEETDLAFLAGLTERTEQTVAAWRSMDGQQGGDRAKLADALVGLAGRSEPPLRFPAGADAVTIFEDRASLLREQADADRDLSSNLAYADA